MSEEMVTKVMMPSFVNDSKRLKKNNSKALRYNQDKIMLCHEPILNHGTVLYPFNKTNYTSVLTLAGDGYCIKDNRPYMYNLDPFTSEICMTPITLRKLEVVMHVFCNGEKKIYCKCVPYQKPSLK